MTAAEKLISYVISQIGTAEDPLGSNKQKYGALIDSTDWYLYKDGNKTWRHLVNGYDWCTQFVDASFITTFTIDKARKILFRPTYNNFGAVVKYAFNYFKIAGRGYTKEEHDPQPGDVIYFQNSKGLSHTGVVIEVTSTKVTTVEGNSGTQSYYVAKHTYSKTSSYIYGYGCPDYESVDPEPDPKELDGYKVGNTYEVVCDDSLMIRKGPGQSYDKVGELHKGDKIVCQALRHDADLNTWLQFDKGWSCGLYKGTRYIDDPEPIHKDGWCQVEGKWYFYQNGVMLKSSWVRYKGDKYYVGADGAMVTGWQTIDRLEYYFYPGNDGHMACDEWLEGYFVNMDGLKEGNKGAWKKDSKGSWWQDAAGWYPKNRWIRIDKKDYQFDSKGYLIK